jgi:hypothetical protein
MIRQRQNQQNHCSLCAGSLAGNNPIHALAHHGGQEGAPQEHRCNSAPEAQYRGAHHPNPAEANRCWRDERSKPVRLGVRDHHTRSLCAESPAQSEQWFCWFCLWRIIFGSAEIAANSRVISAMQIDDQRVCEDAARSTRRCGEPTSRTCERRKRSGSPTCRWSIRRTNTSSIRKTLRCM